MPAPAVDVYKVQIAVNGRPYFVAPPRWIEETLVTERRRPLVDGRPDAPLVPRTLGVAEHQRPEANFQATNFGSDPAVDASGRDFLQAELGEAVTFYPLPPHAHDRWLAQCVAVVDCLDEDHTDWRGEKGRSNVFRYAFRPDVVDSLDGDVFVLPQSPYSSWLCTQQFVDRYAASGLTGLEFDRVMRIRGF